MVNETNQKVVEAYYESSRSLIKVEIAFDFIPELLVVDGDPLERKIVEPGRDLGPVGDKLLEAGLIELIGVPEKEDGSEEYDFVKAGLSAVILSDKQVADLNIGYEKGLRVGYIRSDFSDKSLFFRVPENDVCEFFSKLIDDSNRQLVVESVVSFKKFLDANGSDYLDIGRKIYGLWEDATKNADFSALDKVMEEIYSKEVFLGADLDGVLAVLQIGLSQEADRPADNWWLARCGVLKTLDILEKDGNSYKSESVETVRKIVAEIAYKCFYPEMLYKVVVEPLSKVNYGAGEKMLDGAEMAEIKSRVEEYLTQKKTVTN